MFMSYFFSAKPEQENLGELKQELDVDFHKVWNTILCVHFHILPSVSILTFYQFIICVIFTFCNACVQVSPAELCQRFGTNLETGLTSTQVLVARANI